MNLKQLLANWRAEPSIAGNIQEWRTLPRRAPVFRPFPDALHPALKAGLEQRGIQSLYLHQALSWEHIQLKRNIAVVTGTASGKTLCYALPVLNSLLQDPEARALFIFPTKALAQDQLAGLNALLQACEVARTQLETAIYDGDTPASARPGIRDKARLLISNPDMLHMGILPHHTRWAGFFENLKFIVIDEMHTYRGVFGSHVANVLRRLKRIAAFYGAQPQYLLTSATIANPLELAERLVEEPVSLVDEDGAGRGEKTFLIYNPPVIDESIGLRRSSLQESIRLAQDLLTYGQQTIIFGRSRRTVELILTYLRQAQTGDGEHYGIQSTPSQETVERVRGYRSGYLPHERREIEHGLRRGDVRAVIATNALELGIDIGGMGAVVLVGYPGTIAALWQQAGRAGRGDDPSLAVLVTTAAPLDQFLASHPEYLFERSPEHALIDPDNLLILLDHMRSAAFELPFKAQESFGALPKEITQELLGVLQAQGILHQSGERFFWMADQYPSQNISLRSASANPIVLQVKEAGGTTVIGQVDRASAWRIVHPQAIYLHESAMYEVKDLDQESGLAHLEHVERDYYTEPRSETRVDLIEERLRTENQAAIKAQGEIKVTTQLAGYRKVKWYTHEQLGLVDLTLPPSELVTTGYWVALQGETVDSLRDKGLWSNAPNDYGPGWQAQKERARARDGYSCQICGALESERAHHVHHKIPFRLFTSATQANQLENLVTLCPNCHRRVETAVRVRSGLAGLAYVLSHLAPFFLMCDVGDLGVSADPQSALANGQPCVILYDEIPAGIGLSQRLYEIHHELMQKALELVANCSCSDGCPSCVGPGGENGLGGKRETLAILEALIAVPL